MSKFVQNKIQAVLRQVRDSPLLAWEVTANADVKSITQSFMFVRMKIHRDNELTPKPKQSFH